MKYIKESVTNFDVGVFTIEDAEELYYKYLKKYDWDYSLKDRIHYFEDFKKSYYNKNFNETCRFIIAFNAKDILGICQVADWNESGHYFANSYCSTNKDYFGIGVSKRLLEELFKYFSETYPNETLNFSGYTIDGWLFLRKYVLEYSKKYNVKIKEKGVEYRGIGKHTKDEFDELSSKTKKEIEDAYGKSDYY